MLNTQCQITEAAKFNHKSGLLSNDLCHKILIYQSKRFLPHFYFYRNIWEEVKEQAHTLIMQNVQKNSQSNPSALYELRDRK
jgi:hypothetical protein